MITESYADTTNMDKLKTWLLEKMKAEKEKGDEFWRLKDWLTRVSMAEFKSTEIKFITSKMLDKNMVYEELVAPIKEEIKFWNK